jgi:hypothetical protein
VKTFFYLYLFVRLCVSYFFNIFGTWRAEFTNLSSELSSSKESGFDFLTLAKTKNGTSGFLPLSRQKPKV